MCTTDYSATKLDRQPQIQHREYRFNDFSRWIRTNETAGDFRII